MAGSRAPKQWTLTKDETLNSFTNWKANLMYLLSLDNNFAPFLIDSCTWLKKTPSSPTRGFVDDSASVPAAQRRTGAQKCAHLELMLGQIANYATIISRNTIVKGSFSLNHIWSKIREHYGFQTTGSRFIDLTQIRFQTDEKPEDLYQRLVSFFDDNLVTIEGGLLHHGSAVDSDEDITPSIENVIVLLWLERIHPGLPGLVKQRYGAELRNKTLASIKPQISQALDALLNELQSVEESRIIRAQFNNRRPQPRSTSSKYCVLCRTANRQFDNHYLSQCRFLPEADRRRLTRIRQVESDELDFLGDFPYEDPNYDDEKPSHIQQVIHRRVSTRTSRTRNVSITRGAHTFNLDALVVKDDLGSDIVAGEPFLELNDIAVRSAKKHIIIKGKDVVPYASTVAFQHPSTRRIQTYVCRPQRSDTLFPGESAVFESPSSFEGEVVAVEPHTNSKTYDSFAWPEPQMSTVSDGKITLLNTTNAPIKLKSHDHLCQIRNTKEIAPDQNNKSKHLSQNSCTPKPLPESKTCTEDIQINDQVPRQWKDSFSSLHNTYASVFQPSIGRYNDHFGKVRARVNIGPVSPPNRKLRVPSYSPENQQILQSKFDELEQQGVFARPEDAGVIVEHVSPSFLVRKPSGGHRLVTAFTTIGEYSKTLPTVMPSVEEILRTVSKWKYIIATDLRDAFYQIPLEEESMKWCATPTPFKGLRVYTASAQGMPGSSETLEEMMCTVLGPLIQEGVVAKIADDLYIGGADVSSLFDNWKRTLERIRSSNLTLKAAKTVIAPTKLQLLGWDWNNGTIAACQHKISPLATCEPPKTVTSLRSFIGSFKVFNRIIRGCAKHLEHLEAAIAGKEKSDKIVWTDSLLTSFKRAQGSLSSAESITLPRPTDQLIIVHDGSKVGIGSVLYLRRNDTTKLGGFFSAKLKPHQSNWLPCEIEALSIASSVKHFGPYIRQSTHRTQILTDNKPCVQAWSKMIRGEFSTNSRVATFLSTLSEHSVDVQHISGSNNLPSDFQSRNPVDCSSPSCQVCKFVSESSIISIQQITADTVLSGNQPIPFFNRNALKSLQMECPDLRRVHSHLSQGTRPTTKKKKMTSVKRYLQKVAISRDGVLVVRHTEPFQPERELVVIPQHIVSGIITAIHLRLNHPTSHQMKRVFHRYYFALKADETINHVTSTCSQCLSLTSVPKELYEQSTSSLPPTPGTDFAADVIRRKEQHIFLMRDTLSSYTYASFISNENKSSLLESIITSVSFLRPTPETGVTIRIDNAPGLQALHNSKVLHDYHITLVLGRIHNPNKNPVAEKAISEFHKEVIRLYPDGGQLTKSALATIISQLNSRIRQSGLSAWEIFHQRDQFSGQPISIPDKFVNDIKTTARQQNHLPSAKFKARGGPPAGRAYVKVGSLVYIKGDHDKTKARDRYLVVSIENDYCVLQKLLKSTLRHKKYRLKLTEVFPVIPTNETKELVSESTSSDSDLDESTFQIDPQIQEPFNNDECPLPNIQLPFAQPTNELRRSSRKRKPPAWLRDDYVKYEGSEEEEDKEE